MTSRMSSLGLCLTQNATTLRQHAFSLPQNLLARSVSTSMSWRTVQTTQDPTSRDSTIPPFPPKFSPLNAESIVYSLSTSTPTDLVTLPSYFSAPTRSDLIHRAVLYELNAKRQGTHSTKDLSEIRGSTRKPFPQKGRGKARAGSLRAPQFVGGYKPHGPKPRDHSTGLQRKVYEQAFRSALTAKLNQRQLVLFDSFDTPLESPQDFLNRLQILKASFGLDLVAKRGESSWETRKMYIVHGESGENGETAKALETYTEGLGNVLSVSVDDVRVFEIVKREWCLLDLSAVQQFQDMIGMEE